MCLEPFDKVPGNGALPPPLPLGHRAFLSHVVGASRADMVDPRIGEFLADDDVQLEGSRNEG